MRNMFYLIADSAKQLKNPKALVTTALMTAFGVVLHSFGTIPISNDLMIKWAFLPMSVVGMLYGAVPAAICGGLIDVISTLIMPKASGGFFFGITLCMMASGFLYGLFLYKTEKITSRAIISTAVNFIVVTMLLTTAVLTLSYGSPFVPLLVTRLVKAALLPLEAVLIIVILKALKKLLKNIRR